MKKQKKNLLVTLADENYVEQAKQLFSSVYWNAGWKGDYMLLAHEIPEKKLKWFRDKGILVKKCKSLHNKPVGFFNHPSVILDKLYLFTPEFKKWKNIIYLDADMIVRASLDELTEVNGFAATHMENRKLSRHFLNYKKINKETFNKLSDNLKKNYDLNSLTFNSGVLAFNTDIIKKDSFNKLIKLFKKYNDMSRSAEETSLNILFSKKWIKIPIIYNIFPHYTKTEYSIKPEKIKGIILHFMGQNKPWLLKSSFYKEWENNLKKATLIDLRKILPPREIWTKKDIKKYCLYLQEEHVPHFHKYIIRKIYFFIDKNLSLIRIFLKKHYPKLYFKLKQLKDRK